MRTGLAKPLVANESAVGSKRFLWNRRLRTFPLATKQATGPTSRRRILLVDRAKIPPIQSRQATGLDAIFALDAHVAESSLARQPVPASERRRVQHRKAARWRQRSRKLGRWHRRGRYRSTTGPR